MARSNQLASLAVDIVINARRFRSTLQRTRGDLKTTDKSARNLSRSITGIGLAASAFLIVQRGLNLITNAVRESILAFAKLEKQIVDINKIAKQNVTAEFFQLANELPSASFQQISDVFAASARAGIQGKEALKEFTKSALLLAEVSGDIAPKDAAEGMARLINNFDLGTDKALRLANMMDVLSDKNVTTAGSILRMSQRLSGLAESADITVQDLSALSASLLATGQSATVGRTAFSQLLVKIGQDILKAGGLIGLRGEELKEFFLLFKGNALEGIKEFIRVLSKLNEADRQNALKELGVQGNRIQQVLAVLPGVLGKLTERA